MQFDKSKVYTALNADELKIGSKCIFADTVKRLSGLVESDDMQEHVHVLIAVCDDDEMERFEIDHTTYSLAYLVELPTEPKYKPFSGIEKAFEAIKKHGWWVKEKISGDLKLISCIGKISDSMLSICVGSTYFTSTTLLEDFIFADDGSPCGELAEE